MELWAIGAVLMLTIGVALIGIGWRGRRIDRHPLCAACGYDLIGRPPFTRRCADCGADISGLAIRVGHRACRPRALFGGLALSLPALLVIASMTYVVARGIDVTLHKPSWLLVYELAGSKVTEAAALAELTTRARDCALPPEHVATVAEHCLKNQRNAVAAWNPWWGMFLEAAHASGTLSKEQWARYASQGFAADGYALAPRLEQAVQLTVHVAQSRQTPNARFAARLDVLAASIDGRQLDEPAAPFKTRWRVGGVRRWERLNTEFRDTAIDGLAVQILPPGRHELRATVLMSICEGHEFGEVIATRWLEVRSSFDLKLPLLHAPKITAVMLPAR